MQDSDNSPKQVDHSSVRRRVYHNHRWMIMNIYKRDVYYPVHIAEAVQPSATTVLSNLVRECVSFPLDLLRVMLNRDRLSYFLTAEQFSYWTIGSLSGIPSSFQLFCHFTSTVPFFVNFLLSFFFFFNLSQANQLQTATYYSQDRWEQDRSSHLLARKWQIIFPKIFKVHPVFFNLGPISWLLGTTNIEIGVVLSESAAVGSNKTGCRCRLYLHLNTVNVRSLLSAWIWQPVFV